MSIISFNDAQTAKTNTKSNPWLEASLQQLRELVPNLNAKNAVMFESEGQFIHLATGGVLFKISKQTHWRFKPFPGEHIIHIVQSDAMNQQISLAFKTTIGKKKMASA